MKNKALFVLVLVLVLALGGNVSASETTAPMETEPPQPVEIWTVEDLAAISEDTHGSYVLMTDLDMSGVAWVGPNFYGTFDGNGHAILNLTLEKPGDKVRRTYDGNIRRYDSQFAGLFSTMKDAAVKNLNLINVRALVDTDLSCFVGAIAGYAKNCTFENCSVTGRLELRAYNLMFGIGGLVGYGSGRIDNCDVDVTLISVDTDKKRDEMFLGGIAGMGFFDIRDCDVKLDGYISEYGYVHSGGLMGMMLQSMLGEGTCTITGNSVKGKITFFEANRDSRAYCKAYVGEILAPSYRLKNNEEKFKRDQRWEYKELRPEACETPEYSEEIVAAACNSYGYTSYICTGCGYGYRDHYTLFGDHQVADWVLAEAPTVEKEGLSTGTCGHCGAQQQRSEPKLDPPPTQSPTEAPVTTEQSQESEAKRGEFPGLAAALILAGALLVCMAALLVLCRKK